jgi:hypothetical protein
MDESLIGAFENYVILIFTKENLEKLVKQHFKN